MDFHDPTIRGRLAAIAAELEGRAAALALLARHLLSDPVLQPT